MGRLILIAIAMFWATPTPAGEMLSPALLGAGSSHWICAVPSRLSHSVPDPLPPPQHIEHVAFQGGTGSGFVATVTIWQDGTVDIGNEARGSGYAVGDVLTGGNVTLTVEQVDDEFHGLRRMQGRDPCPNAPVFVNPFLPQ